MIKNWLARGDAHGQFAWMGNGCLDNYKPEETAIIILGDAGFNYYLNKFDERKKMEINARGYHFYCVRGNHEARPQGIPGMQLVYDDEVNGEVYMEERFPNIRYFKDWGSYWIGNYSVAVIGGAYSVDKWHRLARFGVMSKLNPNYYNPKRTGWFPDEQLTEKEKEAAEKEFANNYYDFVFTHTCPIEWQPTDLFLGAVDQSTVDNSTELWLNEMKDIIGWGVWLFAHYHGDRLERPHVEMYYNDIESLDTIYKRWKKYDDTGELDWYLAKSPKFYMS